MIGFFKNAENFSAIILAAGKSSRMGFPKLLLGFDNNRSFLEKLIEEYIAFGCSEIVVVVNEEGFKAIENNIELAKEIKIVINPHPEWERFFSLKLGVGELSQKNSLFVQNIDNPFVDKDTLDILCKSLEADSYACPVFEGKGGHPILLSKEIVKRIQLEEGHDIYFKKFLSNFERIEVNVENQDILLNINTMEDYNIWK